MIIYNHNIVIANIHVYFLETDLLVVFTTSLLNRQHRNFLFIFIIILFKHIGIIKHIFYPHVTYFSELGILSCENPIMRCLDIQGSCFF